MRSRREDNVSTILHRRLSSVDFRHASFKRSSTQGSSSGERSCLGGCLLCSQLPAETFIRGVFEFTNIPGLRVRALGLTTFGSNVEFSHSRSRLH
jgi:hypothetical protein